MILVSSVMQIISCLFVRVSLLANIDPSNSGYTLLGFPIIAITTTILIKYPWYSHIFFICCSYRWRIEPTFIICLLTVVLAMANFRATFAKDAVLKYSYRKCVLPKWYCSLAMSPSLYIWPLRNSLSKAVLVNLRTGFCRYFDLC